MNAGIKFGFSNIAWPESMELQMLNDLRTSGISMIDVVPSRTFGPGLPVDASSVSRSLKPYQDLGISIVGFQSLLYTRPELNIFRQSDRAALLDHFKRLAELASASHAKFLIFGSPNNRARGLLNWTEATKQATDFFRALGEILRSFGVFLCIEHNAHQYGCDFLNRAVEAAEFVRTVNHPNIRMHLDLGNMLMENEDWESMIPQCAELSPYFHLSAPNLKPIDSMPVETIRSVVNMISQFYERFSIEMLTEGSNEDRRASLQKCAGLIREL